MHQVRLVIRENRQKERVCYEHHRCMEKTFSDLKQMFGETVGKRAAAAAAVNGG